MFVYTKKSTTRQWDNSPGWIFSQLSMSYIYMSSPDFISISFYVRYTLYYQTEGVVMFVGEWGSFSTRF